MTINSSFYRVESKQNDFVQISHAFHAKKGCLDAELKKIANTRSISKQNLKKDKIWHLTGGFTIIFSLNIRKISNLLGIEAANKRRRLAFHFSAFSLQSNAFGTWKIQNNRSRESVYHKLAREDACNAKYEQNWSSQIKLDI